MPKECRRCGAVVLHGRRTVCDDCQSVNALVYNRGHVAAHRERYRAHWRAGKRRAPAAAAGERREWYLAYWRAAYLRRKQAKEAARAA